MTPNTQSTYSVLSERIRRANMQELLQMERKITRHYEAGTITASQLGRLDVLLMETLAKNEQPITSL
jgi:hypothetical protein